MKRKLWLVLTGLAYVITTQSAMAASYAELLNRLEQYPQLLGIMASEDKTKYQAKGELGLPDPMVSLGIDNMPVTDPAFDRFLPTSKVIGFNQDIPSPTARHAKSERYTQMAEKQNLIGQYTLNRLEFMLIAKLADYKSVELQLDYIKQQLAHFNDLETTLKGELESGTSVYQRFSEVDVEKAEAERKRNNLMAQKEDLEAEFIRLVDEVPDIPVPDVDTPVWRGEVDTLYPVQIAAQDIAIAQKEIDVADAAFLPNYGVSAAYKQRDKGENGMFAGDD